MQLQGTHISRSKSRVLQSQSHDLLAKACSLASSPAAYTLMSHKSLSDGGGMNVDMEVGRRHHGQTNASVVKGEEVVHELKL